MTSHHEDEAAYPGLSNETNLPPRDLSLANVITSARTTSNNPKELKILSKTVEVNSDNKADQ